MREMDKKKDDVEGKAAKTINFEKIVLKFLEKRAKKAGTKVSTYVNRLARQVVLNDVSYWKEQKKHYWMKFQEAKYQEEQAQIALEVNVQC